MGEGLAVFVRKDFHLLPWEAVADGFDDGLFGGPPSGCFVGDSDNLLLSGREDAGKELGALHGALNSVDFDDIDADSNDHISIVVSGWGFAVSLRALGSWLLALGSWL